MSHVCKSVNCYLHCIKKMLSFLSTESLLHCFVMIRLDYCNVDVCGARDDVKRQLKQVQRRGASVVLRKFMYNNDYNYHRTRVNVGSTLAADPITYPVQTTAACA